MTTSESILADQTIINPSAATRYNWKRQDKADSLGLLDDAWTIHFLNIRFSAFDYSEQATPTVTEAQDSLEAELERMNREEDERWNSDHL